MKIKEVIVRRKAKQYSEECKYCPRIIKGYSESNMRSNLNVHVIHKHPDPINQKEKKKNKPSK